MIKIWVYNRINTMLAACNNCEQESPAVADQTRATRKPAKIAPIRRAYNVVADNTGLSSCV